VAQFTKPNASATTVFENLDALASWGAASSAPTSKAKIALRGLPFEPGLRVLRGNRAAARFAKVICDIFG
jgi:hypothetical protein